MGEITVNTIQRINELYREISTLFVSSLEKAIEMGDLLLEAKRTLDHGQFTPWIEDNFPFSTKTANRWMTLALNKKDLKKLTKGNKALSLTDAYSISVANVVTPKAPPSSSGGAKQGISRRAVDAAQALWDHAPSVPLERYKVSAVGGTVLMKSPSYKNPIMVCSITCDPIPGCEDAYSQLSAGMQALFEQYYSVIESFENGGFPLGTNTSQEKPKRGRLRNVTEGDGEDA